MTLQGWTTSTAVAPLSVVCDGEVVVASGFCPLDELIGRVGAEVDVIEPSGVVFDAVTRYLNGEVHALEGVTVQQPGGSFSQDAWRVMREIPAGQTWTYRELATKAGKPDAVRAAGSACARNRVAPFVPCHRVVRSDGTLGGYAYGRDVKRWLLGLEAEGEHRRATLPSAGRTSSEQGGQLPDGLREGS